MRLAIALIFIVHAQTLDEEVLLQVQQHTDPFVTLVDRSCTDPNEGVGCQGLCIEAPRNFIDRCILGSQYPNGHIPQATHFLTDPVIFENTNCAARNFKSAEYVPDHYPGSGNIMNTYMSSHEWYPVWMSILENMWTNENKAFADHGEHYRQTFPDCVVHDFDKVAIHKTDVALVSSSCTNGDQCDGICMEAPRDWLENCILGTEADEKQNSPIITHYLSDHVILGHNKCKDLGFTHPAYVPDDYYGADSPANTWMSRQEFQLPWQGIITEMLGTSWWLDDGSNWRDDTKMKSLGDFCLHYKNFVKVNPGGGRKDLHDKHH